MKKFGILCASDEELEPFLLHINNPIITKKAMLTFYEGTIYDIPIIALYCGVCKVNAAIASQILIDIYQVDAIINAGIAGGISNELQLFDTVISSEVAYHDVEDEILTEFHPWLPSIYFTADKDLLAIAKNIFNKDSTIFFGRMVTGEKFITDQFRQMINEKYHPLSVDMETGSVGHVCYVNQIPFLAIRSISDTQTHKGIENFEKNCKQASLQAKEITLRLLQEIAKAYKKG